MVEVYQSQVCHVMVMFQYVGIGIERPFHNAERISRVRFTIELHVASIASYNATSSFKVGNTALSVSDNVHPVGYSQKSNRNSHLSLLWSVHLILLALKRLLPQRSQLQNWKSSKPNFQLTILLYSFLQRSSRLFL